MVRTMLSPTKYINKYRKIGVIFAIVYWDRKLVWTSLRDIYENGPIGKIYVVKMVYPLVIACGTQTSLDFTILGSMGQTSSWIHRIGYIFPFGRSDDIII